MPNGESIWVCTHDPSGDFEGRQFSLLDLQFTAKCGNWETGTTWHNLVDHNKMVTYSGYNKLDYTGVNAHVSTAVSV